MCKVFGIEISRVTPYIGHRTLDLTKNCLSFSFDYPSFKKIQFCAFLDITVSLLCCGLVVVPDWFYGLFFIGFCPLKNFKYCIFCFGGLWSVFWLLVRGYFALRDSEVVCRSLCCSIRHAFHTKIACFSFSGMFLVWTFSQCLYRFVSVLCNFEVFCFGMI